MDYSSQGKLLAWALLYYHIDSAHKGKAHKGRKKGSMKTSLNMYNPAHVELLANLLGNGMVNLQATEQTDLLSLWIDVDAEQPNIDSTNANLGDSAPECFWE